MALMLVAADKCLGGMTLLGHHKFWMQSMCSSFLSMWLNTLWWPAAGDYYHGGELKEVDASIYADKWDIRGG